MRLERQHEFSTTCGQKNAITGEREGGTLFVGDERPRLFGVATAIDLRLLESPLSNHTWLTALACVSGGFTHN